MPEESRNNIAPAGEEPAPESRLPWQVLPSADQDVQRPADGGDAAANASANIAGVARAGRIQVVARIADLRKELHKIYRENEGLNQQLAELRERCGALTAERDELSAKAAAQQETHEARQLREQQMLESEQRWQAEIRELRESTEALQAEKQDLAGQLEDAVSVMDEISQALDFSWPPAKDDSQTA
jgi:chromosome segregation ATPase